MDKEILLSYIRNQLENQDQNYLIIVCGKTGSGKSTWAASLCKEFDKNFKIKERCVFFPKQFIELTDTNLPKASAIMYDDAGVSVNARKWWSSVNQAVASVAMTFRTDNLLLVVTVPDFSYIDTQIRKLFDLYVELVGVNRRGKKAIGRVRYIQINRRKGEMYVKRLRVLLKGREVIVGKFKLPFLPTGEWNTYKKMRQTFSAIVKQKALSTIADAEKTTLQQKSISEIVSEIKRSKAFKNKAGSIDIYSVMAAYGTSRDMAQKIKRIIDKGIEVRGV